MKLLAINEERLLNIGRLIYIIETEFDESHPMKKELLGLRTELARITLFNRIDENIPQVVNEYEKVVSVK